MKKSYVLIPNYHFSNMAEKIFLAESDTLQDELIQLQENNENKVKNTYYDLCASLVSGKIDIFFYFDNYFHNLYTYTRYTKGLDKEIQKTCFNVNKSAIIPCSDCCFCLIDILSENNYSYYNYGFTDNVIITCESM